MALSMMTKILTRIFRFSLVLVLAFGFFFGIIVNTVFSTCKFVKRMISRFVEKIREMNVLFTFMNYMSNQIGIGNVNATEVQNFVKVIFLVFTEDITKKLI